MLHNAIMTKGVFALFTVLLTMLLGVQLAINDSVKDSTRAGEGVCNPAGWEETGTFLLWEYDLDVPNMILDCGGTRAKLSSNEIMVEYLRSPGPLQCVWFKTQRAECTLAPRQAKGAT